nr:hypothetical protein FFPRI1PSEUD_47200 [Pseudomonas sp. FFPRI_1]
MPTETQHLEQRVAALQSDLDARDQALDDAATENNERELSRRDWFDEAQRLQVELAERDALLRRALNGGDDSLGLDIAAALSASAEPGAKPQAEPVACMPVERCYDVRAKMIIAFNEAKKAGGDLDDALDAAYKSALRYSPNPMSAEQPARAAVVLPERSPKDYAIEHAEYMAKSADDVLAKFQAYGLALLAVDEGGDDGEGELFEAIDTARGDLQESLVDLRGMVYEFRKRC